MVNRVEIDGRLLERGALRHTPAGVAAIEFRLGHASRQLEAEAARAVDCEVACIALGPAARLLAAAPLGDPVTVRGFLAARSVNSRALVLHVNDIEFKEGNDNGIQAEIRYQA